MKGANDRLSKFNWQVAFLPILMILFSNLSAQHINGITAVATPTSYQGNPYERLSETNANWVCLVPYGFSRVGEPALWYNVDGQWWGEKPEGLITNIKLAKEKGLKIFLKPQVYVPGGWPGSIDFKTDKEWKEWEANYKKFIQLYLDIAIEYDVEMFCVGTEFKISVAQRPQFWKELIGDIRCQYVGKMVYSSNWDNYENISFWEDLDYVGISSYFPLSEVATPTLTGLKKEWQSKMKPLRKYYRKAGKQILFTEYGYLSVDGCAGKTWELEKKVHDLAINEQAQANAFEALYASLWEENFWAGGFIWKWFPEGMGHEGYVPRDYTPQDKKAERIITNWFGKDSSESQ